jgi:hypothetical protein
VALEMENYGVTFLCPEGKYNELATLFLSFPDDTIQLLLKTGEQTNGDYLENFSKKSLCKWAAADVCKCLRAPVLSGQAL